MVVRMFVLPSDILVLVTVALTTQSEHCGWQGYGIFTFLWQFFIPLMVFVVAYWKILGVIRRQAKIMAGHAAITTAAEVPAAGTSGATSDVNHRAGSNGQRQDKCHKIESSSLSKAKINVVRTMIYICVCFTVCWMPMYTVVMITRLKV